MGILTMHAFVNSSGISSVVAYCNFPTKGLRSKRRNSACIFQVVVSLLIRSFHIYVLTRGRLYKTLNHFFNHYFVVLLIG
jgi:hypothetical protein